MRISDWSSDVCSSDLINHVSEADHDLVTAAVAAAERDTDGEIVTVIAAQSNDYDDVALVWASVVAFVAMSVIALFPDFYQGLYDRLTGGWGHGLTANQWLGTVIADRKSPRLNSSH